MYLYIFGSYCRGEIDELSDIDLLIIKDKNEKLASFDLDKYSIYNKDRIIALWNEGNPFAWHLYLEAKLIYSNDNINFLYNLGEPAKYSNLKNDLYKFHKLYIDSVNSLINTNNSRDFDLAMIFLAIRNFASCYSLGFINHPNFSRKSAITLQMDNLLISEECFAILEKSRIISTRGIGQNATSLEYDKIINELNNISDWFNLILNKI